MPHVTDLDLTAKDISSLSSADAVAGFFTNLGYPTGERKALTASSLGLTGDTAGAIHSIELLAADDDDEFRVVFAKVRSITAKVRHDLARKLGQTGSDHLIVLAGNFDVLEFVLIDKRARQQRGPVGGGTVQIIPRTVTVNRKGNTTIDRRVLRRLTWTGSDGLDQFEKLRSVFESAAFTSHYFQNRALFADHYLQQRLPDDAAWRDNPSEPFAQTKRLLRNARCRWTGKGEQVVREELFEPLWKMLGFKAKVNKRADQDHWEPDYLLTGKDGKPRTVALVYRWDRWLDGPDLSDPDTPEENPGAAVVSALANERAQWAIVTNGKLWRLYSREAHSRSTNFYEVDLEEALVASDETDPNEAFRYWWLFFRSEAFKPIGEKDEKRCWLDTIVQGSRDYAKRLGDRLKDRVFVEIFPYLARGFLDDRKRRIGRRKPTEAELADTFEATLTLLYRLLFLLYAEARDLLPVGESPYQAAGLKRIKQEIAEHAGKAEDQVADRLRKAYTTSKTRLYDRLARLFKVMDKGDSMLNVPCYNGGLFLTDPKTGDSREHRIARFLNENKVPDIHLALAIDRLSRDVDERPIPSATGPGPTLPHGLVFIDYKSLEVRHLGSIYEGLLEFKLKVEPEDLATRTEKKKEKYIPLSKAKAGRGKKAAAVAVRKGEVYLSNDKAERKATGSYYTPDPIVEYIVEHTVGPVLREKLKALRGDLEKAGKTFHRHLANARNNPGLLPRGADVRAFAGEKTYAEHKDLVDKLFDFKVLDPAMGSGHFLVEAVDFITDTILDFLNRFPNNPVGYALDKTRASILKALGKQGVTVDANKLTDVNLLKRHVLKRCIYGVDLNPMAVELAKVSLWLDAFTLGAPLSFLDHHLRCGNSLIGASFADLEKTTEGQLFSIDYQPLLDAIRNVLFINAMADATTAEVHESIRRYADARQALSGYKIVFDLLVADHFVDPTSKHTRGTAPSRARKEAVSAPKPSSLLTHAADLDLSTRETFLDSLSGDDERGFVANVESLAGQADRRFFHWEIEFPEVFFGFADADQRRVERKIFLEPGSAGFDAVVGNPPYFLLQGRPEQHILARLHPGFYSGADDVLYYFVKLSIDLLRSRARASFILSRYWTESFHARNLRGYINANCVVKSLVDFRNFQPFGRDVSILCCIPLLSKSPPTRKVSVTRFEDSFSGDLPEVQMALRNPLSFDVTSPNQVCSFDVSPKRFNDNPWFVSPGEVEELLEQMEQGSVPLGDLAKYTQGIKTGLNAAFVVSAEYASQERLEQDILLPLAKGKDVFPLHIATTEDLLIYTHAELDISDFPRIRRHLEHFKRRLEARAECNRGLYPWWRLQRPRDSSIMLSPKILTPLYATYNRFGLSLVRPYYVGVTDTCAFAFGENADLSAQYVAGILNSTAAQFYHKRRSKLKRAHYYEYVVDVLEDFPIPLPSRQPAAASSVEDVTGQYAKMGSRTSECKANLDALNHAVYSLYGFSSTEIRLIERLGSAGNRVPVETDTLLEIAE